MKYKTEWNLGLLYKNEKDPQIEKDMRAIEAACAAFEKKYKGKDFINTPSNLAQALVDNEKLSDVINGSKCWWYFALRTKINSNDSYAGAMATSLDQRINAALNNIKFFSLEVSKISKKDQANYLHDAKLQPYRYVLEQIFSRAKYNLSEKEEQIVSLLTQTSYDMWVEGQQRVLSQEMITHRGTSMPLAQAMAVLGNEPAKTRQSIASKNKRRNEAQRTFCRSRDKCGIQL
jgi:oligoendopeptidase F